MKKRLLLIVVLAALFLFFILVKVTLNHWSRIDLGSSEEVFSERELTEERKLNENPEPDILPGATYNCQPIDGHQYYRTDRTFVIDPTDSDIMYVNVEHKGFFKSTDGGETWELKTKGIKTYGRTDDPTKPCYGEYPVAVIDSGNPQHIILALSGTPSTFDFGYTKVGGIVASTDGAESWKQIIDGWMNIYVADVAIDPKDSQVIYYGTVAQAASYTGADPNKIFVTKGLIYKTRDGGDTWEELPTGFIIDTGATAIYINPENSQEILVTTYTAPRPVPGEGRDITGSQQMGFLKSFDGGQTWQAIHSLPDGFEAVLESTVAQENYKHVFVSPYAPINQMPRSFYSTDGAMSFRQTNIFIDIARFDPYDETGNHLIGYQRTTTGPTFPAIYESNDAGATWTKISDAPKEILDNIALLNQVSNIFWDPLDRNIIYLTGAGGYVWKFDYSRKTWDTILSLDTLPG